MMEYFISKGGIILYNTPVVKVLQDRDGIDIYTRDSTSRYHARYGILCIPPSQTSKITFTPPLSMEREMVSLTIF
jgi:monoamine oxidase